jgi:hypothetical protein
MESGYAHIVIWDHKASVPTSGELPSGLWVGIKPVRVVSATIPELLPVVRATLAICPVSLPGSTRDARAERVALLPGATGARSWKSLEQYGIAYVITRDDKGYILESSGGDDHGRWEMDPDRRRRFPPETDLEVVLQSLLDDLATRPGYSGQ